MQIILTSDDPLNVCDTCARRYTPLSWYNKLEIERVDKTKKYSSCELCDYDEATVKTATES